MSHAIDFINEAAVTLNDARLIAAVTETLCQANAAPAASLSLVISDNERIAALNHQFRGIDAPTDVLSFPSGVALGSDPAPYLGDIIIAYPYAAAQAAREGHDLTQSLMLLVIHGTLHLLGYDHDTAEHQVAMWAAQNQVLEALALPLNLLPSYDHE